MEIALLHQVFLEPGLHTFAEESAVREHHRRATAWLQETHDERQEEISRLLGAELLRKVGLDAVLFTAAEWRVPDSTRCLKSVAPTFRAWRANGKQVETALPQPSKMTLPTSEPQSMAHAPCRAR